MSFVIIRQIFMKVNFQTAVLMISYLTMILYARWYELISHFYAFLSYVNQQALEKRISTFINCARQFLFFNSPSIELFSIILDEFWAIPRIFKINYELNCEKRGKNGFLFQGWSKNPHWVEQKPISKRYQKMTKRF